MHFQRLYAAALALALTHFSAQFDAAHAQTIESHPRYPAGLFAASKDFVDITQAPYNADNSGKTDVTAVVQKAISDIGGGPLRRKTIYFPAGTYLIDDSLRWEKSGVVGKYKYFARMCFEGEDRDHTILKLKDNCEGFGDVAKPKAMVVTNSIAGTGNDAYNDSIWNLTVDVGRGNAGAIGIDWLASNEGSLRNLLVKSDDPGSGFTGVSMNRAYPGPCLLKDVEVRGFRQAMETRHTEYVITFEDVLMSGQSVAGIWNRGNNLCLRHLESHNKVPALRNDGGLVVVVDSRLSNGDSAAAAVENKGALLLRDVVTQGYGIAVKNADANSNVAAGTIAESVSTPALNPWGGPARTLHLPVRETPRFADQDFKNWVSVADFGADFKIEDQGLAIQKALDFAAANGKSTVYFPPGQYICDSGFTVHGSVRRLLGFGSVLRVRRKDDFSDAAKPGILITIKDISGESLTLDGFHTRGYFDATPSFVVLAHESPKILVLTDCQLDGGAAYCNSAGCGDLYVENCVGGPWYFTTPGQHIWARQFDVESAPPLKVTNNGCTLWVLGFKTESAGTTIATSGGGRTEILGGLLYPVRVTGDLPAFTSVDSSISLSYATTAYGSDIHDYGNQIVETRGGVTKTLTRDVLPRHTLGSLVTLYTGYAEAGKAAP